MLELTRQLDSVVQEHEHAIQERDAAVQEHDNAVQNVHECSAAVQEATTSGPNELGRVRETIVMSSKVIH